MTNPPVGPPLAGGTAGSAPGSPQTAVLSRDLSSFLVEFSIALHKNQIYPPGHPLLNTALLGFNDRIHALLATRPTLSIGVARKQLVIEGVATDPENPLLRDLALKLHRHQLGAVKIMADVQDHEVAEFLALLVQDPYLTKQSLGKPREGEDMRRWEHIWLFPLAYDQLELVEEGDGDGETAPPNDRGRGGQLWVGLASAALAGEDDPTKASSADPADVARAIEDHDRETTYDQMIVGYLLQIADELKSEPNPENSALNKRVSRLVNTLRPDTLTRLLEMGGDLGQRHRFVLDASQGMAVNAVMELVKAAADASSQNMSTSLVRLLNKLAVHAEVGATETREGANRELRESVRKLVTGWNLDDPNPNSYTDILEGMSRERPERRAITTENEAEPLRVLQMALEVDGMGETVMLAADALAASGQLGVALDALEQAPKRNETSMILFDYLVTPERLISQLADESKIDFDVIDRLSRRLGSAAAEPLLDAYAAAENRTVRRKLHDRVTVIGAGIGPQVVSRLTGTPWYVQRNMLTLLASMKEWPPRFSPEAWAGHEDPRVRKEAYRLLFRMEERRATALSLAIADADDGIQRMALGTAADACPSSLADRLEGMATDNFRTPEIRGLALRAVGGLRLSSTRDIALKIAVAKRGIFRRARLQPKGPELLAALRVLAQYWADDDDAKVALRLAANAEDSEISSAGRPRRGKE